MTRRNLVPTSVKSPEPARGRSVHRRGRLRERKAITMLRRTPLLTAIAAAAFIGAPLALSPNGPGIFAASSALAATSVKIDIFFSTLQPYGGWVHHPDYNYVWIPTGVDRNWSPYTHGHW